MSLTQERGLGLATPLITSNSVFFSWLEVHLFSRRTSLLAHETENVYIYNVINYNVKLNGYIQWLNIRGNIFIGKSVLICISDAGLQS